MAETSITFVADRKPLVGKNNQYLRGTVLMLTDDPTLGKLGIEMQGCLVNRRKDGSLEVRPPLIRTSYGTKSQWTQVAKFTPDMVALLARQIEDSKLAAMIAPDKMAALPEAESKGGSAVVNLDEDESTPF